MKIRIKGPYSKKETEFLKSHIYGGLKQLKDIGKGVNYEEFCQYIIESLPSTVIAPEWILYWQSWKDKFRMFSISQKKKRHKIFEECIIDLKTKGLLPNDISGLTATFSQKIEKIIQEKTPSD